MIIEVPALLWGFALVAAATLAVVAILFSTVGSSKKYGRRWKRIVGGITAILGLVSLFSGIAMHSIETSETKYKLSLKGYVLLEGHHKGWLAQTPDGIEYCELNRLDTDRIKVDCRDAVI